MGQPIEIGRRKLLRRDVVLRIQSVQTEVKDYHPKLDKALSRLYRWIRLDPDEEITTGQFYYTVAMSVPLEIQEPLLDALFNPYEIEFGSEVKAFFTKTTIPPSSKTVQ